MEWRAKHPRAVTPRFQGQDVWQMGIAEVNPRRCFPKQILWEIRNLQTWVLSVCGKLVDSAHAFCRDSRSQYYNLN